MNIQQLQVQYQEKYAYAKTLLAQTQAQATSQGRVMTSGELALIDAAIAESKRLKAQIDGVQTQANMTAEIDRLTAGMIPSSSSNGAGRPGSIGHQVVSDPRFQDFIRAGGHRASGQWSSPVIELSATTLDESSGSGGALVIPDTQRRIIELPTRPLTMIDLIAPGTTDSNSVGYMKETAITNAAAVVAEGAPKPESTLVFAPASDPVRKLASWIPVTEEILEDVPTMRAYVDARLRLFVDLATDDELLNGSGVGAHIEGFLARVGLATSIARVAEANADTILDQIMSIWISTNLQPTGIVMNPVNWKTVLKTKDTTGQYYGGGPFASPRSPSIWGLPIALSTAITAGTCLVGAFATAAQWFEKSGLRVDVSNSHGSFFVENKIAIRAERRGALAVYRPAAFGTCTNLN